MTQACVTWQMGRGDGCPPTPARPHPVPPTAPLLPADHLQEAEVPIIGNQACEKMYHQNSPASSKGKVIKDDMLCAGRQGRSSCQVRHRPCPLSSVLGPESHIAGGPPQHPVAHRDLPLQGDAGGPLVCYWSDEWLQVGVLSWSMASGHVDYPCVYTRVMSYSSWILQHIPFEP